MSLSDFSYPNTFYRADAKFKGQLKILSTSSFWGEHLIVKRQGDALILSKTNAFSFLIEKFKGLLGLFNGANHRLVEFTTLGFLLKGRKGVEQREDFLRVQALAQKAGLFSCSKNGSSEEERLIEDIRQTLFSSNKQEKVDGAFSREGIEGGEDRMDFHLLDRFSAQYQKELEPFFKQIKKVKDAFSQANLQDMLGDRTFPQKEGRLQFSKVDPFIEAKQLEIDQDKRQVIPESGEAINVSCTEETPKHQIKELTAKEIITERKWSTLKKVGACFIAFAAAGLGVYLFYNKSFGKSAFSDDSDQASRQEHKKSITKPTKWSLISDYTNGMKYRINKDFDNAFIWYKKAAEQGSQESMEAIEDYRSEMGVSDSKLALIRKAFNEASNIKLQELIAKAIKSGSADDCWSLGMKYLEMKDYKNAFIWFRKAAEQGDRPSLKTIEQYKSQMGVSESDLDSIRKAFNEVMNIKNREVVTKTLEWRSSGHYCEVGFMFLEEKDYKNAFIWFRKAAEQGDRPSLKTIEQHKSQMGVSESDLDSIRKACDEAQSNV